MPLNASTGHLKKGKLAKTIFDVLKTDASKSKCSYKMEGQTVNLYDGDGMQVPC